MRGFRQHALIGLDAGAAGDERELLEAQRLRYRVFAGEVGTRLSGQCKGGDQDICDYVIGCTSTGLADGGHTAASIYNALSKRASSPVEYRVFPRCRLMHCAATSVRRSWS